MYPQKATQNQLQVQVLEIQADSSSTNNGISGTNHFDTNLIDQPNVGNN